MAYWLIKSEPEAYSWADLVRDGETSWTGVRNHQAANNLKAMRQGDRALFYHSVSEKAVVGIARITAKAHPDPTDATGKWVTVTVTPEAALPHPVTLAQIKAEGSMGDFALIRQSRLSVVPVSPAQWETIVKMADAG